MVRTATGRSLVHANALMKMMIYSAGKEVQYNGKYYTVSHVHISGFELLVCLNGLDRSLPAEEVYCEPTELNEILE